MDRGAESAVERSSRTAVGGNQQFQQLGELEGQLVGKVKGVQLSELAGLAIADSFREILAGDKQQFLVIRNQRVRLGSDFHFRNFAEGEQGRLSIFPIDPNLEFWYLAIVIVLPYMSHLSA